MSAFDPKRTWTLLRQRQELFPSDALEHRYAENSALTLAFGGNRFGGPSAPVRRRAKSPYLPITRSLPATFSGPTGRVRNLTNFFKIYSRHRIGGGSNETHADQPQLAYNTAA